MFSRLIPKGKNLLLIDTQKQPLLNTIYFDEYIQLHTQMVPISHRKKQNIGQIIVNLEQRQVQFDIFNPLFNIGAVVVNNQGSRWEEKCQILCDLVTAKDGKFGNILQPAQDNDIEFFWSDKANDLKFAFEICHDLLFGSKAQAKHLRSLNIEVNK